MARHLQRLTDRDPIQNQTVNPPSYQEFMSSTPTENAPKTVPMTADDIDDLREAKEALQHHGLADRLTEMIGAPMTATIQMLPDAAEGVLHSAVEKALQKALDVAIATMGESDIGNKPRLMTHKVLSGLAGAAGGAFGLASVAAELPVSTVLILRSVADIARSQGEDLSSVESRLACLEVFALDSGKGLDASLNAASGIQDATEIGYFAVRAGMAKQIAEASKYLLRNSAADLGAPPLVQLISKIGSRFGVVVSQKAAAQAIPIIGAVGGALINSYFIDHYQDLARAHFTIRRLERTYGGPSVRLAYEALEIPA